MNMFSTPEPNLLLKERLKIFAIVHWRGLVCLFVPILFIYFLWPFPPQKQQWIVYCFLVMVVFWVTECIPLPVTSLLPLFVFPLSGVKSTIEVCNDFISEPAMMIIGSLILAASVEQSGLHKRLAFIAIQSIGFSHKKLLVAIVVVTTFLSMGIRSTAATSMMVPIIFGILKVFEDHNFLKIYDVTESGEKIASDITTCYFCSATFSASIGGIVSLASSQSSEVMKRFFIVRYNKKAPDFISSGFSAFGIPYMILLDIFMILYLLVKYVGFLRPNSAAAKRAKIPPENLVAAEATLSREYKALGPLTFWEFMVILLFGGAMVSLFFRSPIIFYGWGDYIKDYFALKDSRFVQDSALAALVVVMMLLFPSNLSFCKNLKAKFYEDLPKKGIPSVLNWKNMMAELPFSFLFLLGARYALSNAVQTSTLNNSIYQTLKLLQPIPKIVLLLLIIILIIMLTNFSTNAGVCRFFIPISMHLASKFERNPFAYALASILSASFGFLMPMATSGNLIVHGVAKIPTIKMVIAGSVPTITTIIITWLGVTFYAPYIWSDLHLDRPSWSYP